MSIRRGHPHTVVKHGSAFWLFLAFSENMVSSIFFKSKSSINDVSKSYVMANTHLGKIYKPK